MNLRDLGYTLPHFILVFLGQHWLVAFVNAGMTALLGAGLLLLARRGRLFPASKLLGIFHLVLLVALLKGAFYLVLGDSMHPPKGASLVLALQFPDPIESLGLSPQSRVSIWHPTTDTEWVSTLLLGWALLFFIKRIREMSRSQEALHALVLLNTDAPSKRVAEVLLRAGVAMDLPAHALPPLVLAEVGHPTPLLLGVTRPCLLLAPHVADALTGQELELALRHELAHLRRRDHWGRWVLTWALDVGRLSFISPWLGMLALDAEEALCDRMAVQSAQDAVALGGAITKAVSLNISGEGRLNERQIRDVSRVSNELGPPGQGGAVSALSAAPGLSEMARLSVPPGDVIPALQGHYLRQRQSPTALRKRLEALTGLAEEFIQDGALSSLNSPPSFLRRFLVGTARAGFIFVVFVVLYVKIHLTLTPH